MWGMTFEKSLRMFSPRPEERACHKRIASGIKSTLELMKRIEQQLKRGQTMSDDKRPGSVVEIAVSEHGMPQKFVVDGKEVANVKSVEVIAVPQDLVQVRFTIYAKEVHTTNTAPEGAAHE